jgi:hypothetical protein
MAHPSPATLGANNPGRGRRQQNTPSLAQGRSRFFRCAPAPWSAASYAPDCPLGNGDVDRSHLAGRTHIGSDALVSLRPSATDRSWSTSCLGCVGPHDRSLGGRVFGAATVATPSNRDRRIGRAPHRPARSEPTGAEGQFWRAGRETAVGPGVRSSRRRTSAKSRERLSTRARHDPRTQGRTRIGDRPRHQDLGRSGAGGDTERPRLAAAAKDAVAQTSGRARDGDRGAVGGRWRGGGVRATG